MGRPGPKLTVQDDQLIVTIKRINGPFATAVEVADEVDLTPEHVRKRLRDLEERGVLESKRAGQAVGYWTA